MFASFTGACVEIGLCHAWATGMINYQEDFRGNFLNNLILGSLVTFWRIPHFHIMHRGMHPWRTTSIPGTGLLYSTSRWIKKFGSDRLFIILLVIVRPTQLSNIKLRIELTFIPKLIKTKKDFGKFLYRHVHALHHKSYNPTAFSGTNMHPVESTLYYTAAFIPCLWGGHPILGTSKA